MYSILVRATEEKSKEASNQKIQRRHLNPWGVVTAIILGLSALVSIKLIGSAVTALMGLF